MHFLKKNKLLIQIEICFFANYFSEDLNYLFLSANFNIYLDRILVKFYQVKNRGFYY